MQQFTEFPIEVCSIKTLHTLFINGFTFTTCPEELGKLQNLRNLCLRFNKFATLPDCLWTLAPNLENLDLSGNYLTELDYQRMKTSFTSLEALDLSFNQFTSFSVEESKKRANPLFGKKMPKLKNVHIVGNPLSDKKLTNIYLERDDYKRAIRYYTTGKPLPARPGPPEVSDRDKPQRPTPDVSHAASSPSITSTTTIFTSCNFFNRSLLSFSSSQGYNTEQ